MNKIKTPAFFERFPRIHWFIPLVVFLLYANALGNGFVLDDPSQVLSNRAVQNFDVSAIFFGSTFGVGAKNVGVYYKPVMAVSYAAIDRFFGGGAWAFHLVQILLHAVNSIIVFYIFRQFFKKGLALFLALVFAVHPLNSESVLYISALQEPLFFIFGSLALLISIKYRVVSIKYYALFGLLIAGSLLSKETGVLFLAIITVYRLIFCFEKGQRKQTYVLLFLCLAVFAVYLGLRQVAVGLPVGGDRPYPVMRLTLMERFVNVPEEVFYYLRNFFVPRDFAVAQHWVVTKIDWRYFWKPLIIDLGVIGFFTAILISNFKLQIYNFKFRARSHESWAYGFFFVWFVMGMLPHLNIFPLDVTTADRWFYFPMVGLLGMIGMLVDQLPVARDQRLGRKLLGLLALLVLLVLSTRTFVRTFDWRNGLTLATRDIKYSRDSFPLENNFAFELMSVGRWDEALVHAKKSTELGPWWWLNWNNLGVIYRHKGSAEDAKYFADAEGYFRKATEDNNTFYMPYENLAELLVNYDTPEKASQFIIESSKKMDLSGRLWFYLAIAQSLQNDSKGALQAAERAKIASPEDQQIQMLYQGLTENKKIIFQKPVY